MNDYRLDDFLYMTWLRPENVVWDSVASYLIGNELLSQNVNNILDIGIGNGYFSFMTLGGKFKKEYDWYYNVNTDGFLDNEDIYNTINISNIEQYIQTKAKKNITLAVDHKDSLLQQAKQLQFINNALVQDANISLEFDNIDTVYSNILYWLNNPIEVLKNIDNKLNKNSKIILAFPNKNFYKYALSYTNNNSKIWSLLNRGRAECMMWSMNMNEFESQITANTTLKIEKFQTYLSELNIKTWDIGFRPFSQPLIKMANKLSIQDRMEIKEEWVHTAKPYVEYIMEDELANGATNGAFNFVVLTK